MVIECVQPVRTRLVQMAEIYHNRVCASENDFPTSLFSGNEQLVSLRFPISARFTRDVISVVRDIGRKVRLKGEVER